MSETTIDRKAMDELKKSVHDLADTVQGWKRGQLDEDAVARIATRVMEGSRSVGRRRNGPMPGAYDDGDTLEASAPQTIFDIGAPSREVLARGGRDRAYEIQGAYAGKVAEALGMSERSVRELHAATDTVVLASAYLGKEPEELDFYRDRFAPLRQALDTGTPGEGIEYVPKELSGTLVERVNLELRVASLFPAVQMPTQPFELPGVAVSRQRTGTKAEATGDAETAKFVKITPATRKISLSATKLGVEVIVSKEMEEDSIVAIIPMVQNEIVDYLSGDVEDAVINGDNTSPHQDSDVTDFTDPQDPRTAWNGLRQLTPAGSKTDASNAVLTSAMLRTNRSKMGRYGTRADQLAHVIAMRSYISLLSDVNVQTLEKYGPQATILSGELGRIDGAPILVSEYVRQDLNASGVFDGVTTSRTLALTIARAGFLIGDRRGITVQVLRELYAESDQDAIVASLRKAFVARFPSTETIVAMHFNIA